MMKLVLALTFLFSISCSFACDSWTFYDLTKSPVGVINLTETVRVSKDFLYNSKGSFQGVTLGDLSFIQAKIVIARTNENSHTHNNDVFSVVFEGAGTMNTFERAMFSGSGDSFVVPANTLHFTVNHKNVSLDAEADAARDYIVFLSSFSPQPYSRIVQDTTLQPTTPPADLSTTFRAGKFSSIRGADKDVQIGSLTSFARNLITTSTSTTSALKLTNSFPIRLPYDALYVVMEGQAVLRVNGESFFLNTKDFFIVPNNTNGAIDPIGTTRLIINTNPNYPTPSVAPCSASVAVTTQTTWVEAGVTHYSYALSFTNEGTSKIVGFDVSVTGTAIDNAWNLQQLSANTYSASLWNFFEAGATISGSHGFNSHGGPAVVKVQNVRCN